MDNTLLYTLIALLVVLFFFLFLYNQYHDLENKIAKKAIRPEAVVINETVKNETVIVDKEEEVKRIKEEVEISSNGSGIEIGQANMDMANILSSPAPVGASATPNLNMVPPTASIVPVPSLPASARVAASAAPAGAAASTSTATSTRIIGPGVLGFEDYNNAKLDLPPKIYFTTDPEPPTISGLMRDDLTELKHDLNYFFKTSDVSRQKKRGPALIQPKPEHLPEIKHLYGDGSYDDIDGVHVYKTQ